MGYDMASFNIPIPLELRSILNRNSEVILNADQPAAPSDSQNVSWQTAQIVYSVAGTPLPSAAAVGMGARAFVSDATAVTFGAPYVGSRSGKIFNLRELLAKFRICPKFVVFFGQMTVRGRY